MRKLKLLAGLVLLIFATMIILGLWKFGTILGFFLVYPWVFSKILGVVINPHLANAIALIVAIALYFGIYKTIYKRHKNWGYVCFIGIFVLQSIFTFFGEQNRFFSLTSGEPIKYYTTNPITGEVQVFDRPIYDAFGQKAVPITFRIAQDIYRQEHGVEYPNKEVPYDRIKNFFDQRTARPLAYYYLDQEGYHLFLHDGYDPMTGKALSPVTSGIVERLHRSYSVQSQSVPDDQDDRRSITFVLQYPDGRYYKGPSYLVNLKVDNNDGETTKFWRKNFWFKVYQNPSRKDNFWFRLYIPRYEKVGWRLCHFYAEQQQRTVIIGLEDPKSNGITLSGGDGGWAENLAVWINDDSL